ncbi:MAG: hypothetical protein QF918_14625, partial [Pirellulaceae bacterium]|nr:hypothetical protein [Pirellulaceae bacterium]
MTKAYQWTEASGESDHCRRKKLDVGKYLTYLDLARLNWNRPTRMVDQKEKSPKRRSPSDPVPRT